METTTSRRRMVRRGLTRPPLSVRAKLVRRGLFWPALYLLTLTVIGSAVAMSGRQRFVEHVSGWRTLVSPTDWLQRLGVAGLIALIGLGMWVYVWAYNRRIAQNSTRGFALTSLFLTAQCLAVAFTLYTGGKPHFIIAAAVFPALLVSIILAIAYDQRFALAAGAALTMLVTVSLKQTLPFGIMLLTGIAVAVAQLNEVRTRTKLLWVGLWTGLALGAAAFFKGLLEEPLNDPHTYRLILNDVLVGIGTGLGTGLFVQGILPAIEGLFKVSTALSIKDLSDASHPLLRKLSEAAPGTYQHSLRLADLVEEAAVAIHANSLLCKVGALYHDIGKINKSDYFIENQADGQNRHVKLSPAMSQLIIVGHVKDGVAMAREYHLPHAIRHFVESHHGTTLVEYFYHAAKRLSEQNNAPAPAEFEFRYPGPKPHTKEAAILMLGDSLESAARTLEDPTPSRIEQLVHSIANARLNDGQFSECSLTLEELHKIEQSMVRTLTAMHHARIKYPSNVVKEAAPAQAGAGSSTTLRVSTPAAS